MPDPDKASSRKILDIWDIFPAAALIAFAFYCGSLGAKFFWGTLGTGALIAIASGLTGALLGFLFGIPRSIRGRQQVAIGDPNSEDDRGYRPSTNLEDVSDWLTKIIVGVGLVQLGTATATSARLIHTVGNGLGGTASARIAGGSLLIVFAVFGFIKSYLWVYTSVTDYFRNTYRKLVSDVSDTIRQDLQDQAHLDALAHLVVQEVLDPPPGTPTKPQEQIDEVIAKATPEARLQIFDKVRERRRSTWKDDKAGMARTIPIFHAIIKTDTSGEFHQAHGQLGYALKDQAVPDWQSALSELSLAIERRGPVMEKGWPLYEFNRALCLINLDSPSEGESPSHVREQVVADMHALKQALPDRFYGLTGVPIVKTWLQRNNLRPEMI
ncbi:hypothetical protein [Streptomyces sp. NPDC007205]|uniref:hypothetical protein n=1 Tax=Streptomyces sp. NPDC007205 TaxID=3154316 RepID=UPI00340E46A0